MVVLPSNSLIWTWHHSITFGMCHSCSIHNTSSKYMWCGTMDGLRGVNWQIITTIFIIAYKLLPRTGKAWTMCKGEVFNSSMSTRTDMCTFKGGDIWCIENGTICGRVLVGILWSNQSDDHLENNVVRFGYIIDMKIRKNIIYILLSLI
jgi:hypothetical protein